MNKNNTGAAPLGELFVDATKEVIEKGRIKAQMMRLSRIMEVDQARKKSIYAEIGKMYVEGTIATNKGKLSYALKTLRHLDLRLERAEARYEMLKEARCLDECTDAFRKELANKINQAKDSAAIAAYGVKKKAKKIVSGISEKSSDTILDVKAAAKNATAGKKKSAQKEEEDAVDFKTLLAELEIADTEEEIEENAELNAVLNNIDAILREVEEEVEQEAEQEAPTSSTPAIDGESAESFDF